MIAGLLNVVVRGSQWRIVEVNKVDVLSMSHRGSASHLANHHRDL